MEDKQNNQQLEVFDRLSRGNKFVFYIYRKITKISCAVYLITDLIKDIEPLKWQLRKTASEMMSLKNFFDEKAVFNTLEERLLDLEGMLELGKISRVISEMNGLVVQTELRKLLEEMRQKSKEGFYLPELVSSFFEVAKPEAPTYGDFIAKDIVGKHESYKGHKGQGVRYDLYNQNHTSNSGLPRSARLDDQSGSKGQRRDEILKIIKVKGFVTIKDITELVKDCSEKTVQRELLGLVEEGTVKKTGERRWSRYSIAQ